MAKKMTQNPFEKDYKQAFLLALLNAGLWLWGSCLALYWKYHGGGNYTGDGSLYIIITWIIALAVAWLVSKPVCMRLYGYFNKAGFIVAGFIAIPIAIVCSLPLDWLTLNKYSSKVLAGVFYVASLFGLFPEGLRGSKIYSGLILVFVFVCGFIGFYLSSRKLKKILLLLISGMLCGIKTTYAYDVLTHQKYLTTDAIVLLNTKAEFPYYEITHMMGQLMTGTGDEDATPRFLTHFYRPTDEKGLLGTFPNAKARLQGDWATGGTNFIEEAINQYNQTLPNKTEAYKNLGHILHLASQDMFSPPHVSDDAHLIPDYQSMNFAPDSYETWVYGHYNLIGNSPYHQGAVVPTIVWPPLTSLHLNAWTTYTTTRIQGNLIKDPSNPASGNLMSMFPGITYVNECVLSDDITGACISYEGVWTIPNYGSCRENTGRQGSPGLLEHWWAAQNFSGEPQTYFYFENPSIAYPAGANGKSLSELWALDNARLIAKSQEASAGIIKAFAKAVDQVNPKIELRKNTAQGEIIPTDGSGFGGENIYIKINDPSGTDTGGNPDLTPQFLPG